MEHHRAEGGIVIVGAGIAGLWTALKLAPIPVLIITAGEVGAGSSSWAQGGMAAAVGPCDSPHQHAQDTLSAGAGLTDPAAAHALCDAGPEAVQDLLSVGVPFDRADDGGLRLGREAAHSRSRIVHVGGDEAGAAIMGVLAAKAQAADHIDIRTRMVAEHISKHEGRVSGLACWDIERQRRIAIEASTVILATGGIGGLYAVTTNPLSSRGSGLALAAQAGANLRDLEFVQFHPTGLNIGRDPAPLATEAIRGEGGKLVDNEGRRFMLDLHPDAELAPRDIVARGVASAIHETGAAFLDVRGTLGKSFRSRFTTVDRAVRSASLNPEADLLPIAPAAHYHMGGVATNNKGLSSVPGLYAIGECASTGVHGGNRLASNSLLEAIVFGSKAAEAIRGQAQDTKPPFNVPPGASEGGLSHGPPRANPSLRQALSKHAGLLRDGDGLRALLATLSAQEPQTIGEQHIVLTATLLALSALEREESRGAHQRLDYPESRSPQHTLLRLESDGTPHIWQEDVPQ